jgi:peptidoglycan/LPS O-acetylase OafA/YrhL
MTDRPTAQMTVADAFDARSNSIGFLRWLMAFLVIFSHAGPLGSFYGGHDLGTQLSAEQSLGGVAVAGFFFFSGYLITNSRRGRSTIFRYFWRRCLRIFPAFWTALLLTAFVLAPLAWWHTRGSLSGYWDADRESPLTYFRENMFLALHQRNIAEMGQNLPLAKTLGVYDWNGSAWTLQYEFKAYILVGFLGLFGALVHRGIATIVAAAIIVLNVMTWSDVGNLAAINPALADPFNAMLLAPFAFGMLFALWPDKIPVDDRLALACLAAAFYAYNVGGWNVWGQYGLLYALMWFAVRVRALNNWERFGDFSYGIYIFAWPLMTFAAFFGLHRHGWLVYHLVIIVAVHLLAFASWHLIEKPAMSLKNWTPRPLSWVLRRGSPWVTRAKRRLVDPHSSSAPYAEVLRRQAADGPVVAAPPASIVPSAPTRAGSVGTSSGVHEDEQRDRERVGP